MSAIRARFTALQLDGMQRAAVLRAGNTSSSLASHLAWQQIADRLWKHQPCETLELDTIDAGTLADDLGNLCLLLRGTPDSTAIASLRGAIRKIRLAIEAS